LITCRGCGKPLGDPFAVRGDRCDGCLDDELAFAWLQEELRLMSLLDLKLRERPNRNEEAAT
jgi:hypothetical protein